MYSQDLVGYATFPSDFSRNPQNDGVVVLFSTLPGGLTPCFNLGRVRFGFFFYVFYLIPPRPSPTKPGTGSVSTTPSKEAACLQVTM